MHGHETIAKTTSKTFALFCTVYIILIILMQYHFLS